MSFHIPEKSRVVEYFPLGESSGAFLIQSSRRKSQLIRVIASEDGGLWEHVSASLETRTPTWDEMCFVKNLFWDEEDCVIQYHPPKSEYVNCHPYCLHLWRPIGKEILQPEGIFV